MYTKSSLAQTNVVQMPACAGRLPNGKVFLNAEKTGTNAVNDHARMEIAAVESVDRRITRSRMHWYEPAVSRILDDTTKLWFG
ncbi:MAG: hypothetical protein ACOYNZ_03160 [Rhodoferax sp.]